MILVAAPGNSPDCSVSSRLVKIDETGLVAKSRTIAEHLI